jgi:NAD(P)-dependent dehydrogenase (short-subunit alcohol dehydrogenase family)
MTAAPADRSPGRLAGRVALITGASRGLGAAAAVAYAGEGAHCVLVARTVGGLEALDDQIKALGGSATLGPLDITDGPGIDRLGAALYERYGRLDVLLGNAGILGTLSPVGHIEPTVFERVMAVNVTANWRLIRTLDPLLRRSDAAGVIFVTSSVARSARAYWAPYSVSKAALEALAKTYANETADTPIRVNLVDPGALATGMRAEAYPGEDQATLPTPEQVTEIFVKLAMAENDLTGQLLTPEL